MITNPHIQQLTVLQEQETQYLDITSHSKSIPKEKNGLESKIFAEREALEVAKKTLQQLEVKLKEIDLERKSTKERIVTYKNQQLHVKKNEEYTALENEIATAIDRVHQLEEEELNLMVKIEDEQTEFKREKVRREEKIREIEIEIERLEKRKLSLEENLKKVADAIQTATAQVDETWLNTYTLVKNNVGHPPFIVPLENHKCKGCHLRVSNDVQIGIQQHPEKVHYCDQCGRIVY